MKNLSKDRKFLKYILKCSKNITDSKEMEKTYGLIPPMIQLFKLSAELEVYLNEKPKE